MFEVGEARFCCQISFRRRGENSSCVVQRSVIAFKLAAAAEPKVTMSKGKIFFDLDNTLYSYEATGLHIAMRKHIDSYFAKHLDIPDAEAAELANTYYHKYGLAGLGLLNHHADKVDIEDYLAYVHDELPVDETLKADPALAATLTKLGGDGWESWIFTNSTIRHARRCLKALGVHEAFVTADGVERIVEIDTMWKGTREMACTGNKAVNKPDAGAYDVMAAVSGLKEGEKAVMVEDSPANLAVPKQRGWVPVWIGHGSAKVPAAVTDAGYVVINAIDELAAKLD